MQQRGCCRGPRPADLSTHAERASSEEAVVCQLGGKHCCLDAERPLHRHTLPPCVRSNMCQSSREGSWRHRWQWIRQTPIAAPRLASSSANAFFERAAGMSQHNQGSAQPRCCTSRVNRESARTGNIARPFVVSVDDVSPNSASEATGRLWAQRVLRSPRDWTRQSETEQDKGQCRPGEASGREYGPYRVCRQPKALLRRADFTDHVSLLSAGVWRFRSLPTVCAEPSLEA